MSKLKIDIISSSDIDIYHEKKDDCIVENKCGNVARILLLNWMKRLINHAIVMSDLCVYIVD